MALSPRLRAVVDTLPLTPGLRVIEIGCGPGAAARAVAELVGPGGHVLAEVLQPGGRLMVDGGTPLRAITIPATGTDDA